MVNSKSTKVPAKLKGLYAALTEMTDRFCADHLDSEYAELARYAIAALCRKRPSPLTAGKLQTWACAVLYALGQVNFLSDKASKPYMAMADLCGHFGVAASTGGNKAKLIRDALAIRQFDHVWMLPSRIADRSQPWFVMVNGLIANARDLPLDLQIAAAEKGLIPYACVGEDE